MTSIRPTAPRGFATLLSFVKFEHTLFALPFAYCGMLLAADGWPGWRAFVLVTVAMVGARTCAMAANRVIDARLDALNPRTSGREIPSGRLSGRDGILVAAAGLALLVYAGASLNPLTLVLLPVAVLFLVAYPYTKRFTWACHLWLGVTIGAAAAGGFIAVTGAFAPVAWLLWFAVAAWVAGFDVLYGVLDVDFDRANGVHSIPADLGIDGAIRATAVLYVAAVAALCAVWVVFESAAGGRLGWPFLVAVAVVTFMLVEQHRQLRTHRDARVLEAFNANMIVGPLMLLGTVLGLALN
jgi:4-hydroxybenzoate polyprenyltransferase